MYREFANMNLATEKNMRAALKFAKKAAELEESAGNYYVLGKVYYEKSDMDNALKAFRRALALEPQNTTVRQAYNSAMKRGTQ